MITDSHLGSARILRWYSPRIPRVLRMVLEIPLEIKLLGANLLIVAIAFVLIFGPLPIQPERVTDVYIVVAAMTVGATVNVALVKLALRPIESLEDLSRWIADGRPGQRVPPSIVADPELKRLSNAINQMLDGLAGGREQMEKLRAEIIYAAERERFKVAQQLNESVGQKLADASFKIAKAANQEQNSASSSPLADARKLLRAAVHEIQNIARTAHPHVAAYREFPAASDELNEKSRRGSFTGARSSPSIARLLAPDLYKDLSRRDIRDIGLGVHRARRG